MYFPSKILQKYVDAAVQCYNDKVLICEKSGKHVCSGEYINDINLPNIEYDFTDN